MTGFTFPALAGFILLASHFHLVADGYEIRNHTLHHSHSLR